MAHGYHAITQGAGEGLNPGYSASNSAVAYSSSEPMSFEDYYYNTGGNTNPYSIWAKIGNFFTGKVSSAEQSYQQYLADFEYKRNQEAAQKANEQTWAREDTAVQRALADYKSAGLNPYLLVNAGSAVSAPSSQAQHGSYKRGSKRDKDSKGSALSTALKLLAILAIKG